MESIHQPPIRVERGSQAIRPLAAKKKSNPGGYCAAFRHGSTLAASGSLEIGGRYAPGAKFPTKAELAYRFGVNRDTVRRVLRNASSITTALAHWASPTTRPCVPG